MKFNVKKFVIVLVSIIAVSFLISGILFYTTGGVNPSLITSAQIKTNKTFKTEGLEKIEVNAVSPNIQILETPGKEIIVDFYGSISSNLGNNSPKLITEFANGVLNINISYPKTFSLGLFDISNIFLDIYIPSQFVKEINVTSISGDINVESFNGAKIKIKSTSGDLKAKYLKAGEIQAESVSGDINFKIVEGSLNLSTISGEVNAGISSLMDNILIKTTSGDVKLALPESSEFIFNLESLSGGVENNFDSKIEFESERNIQGRVGNGIKTIKITTISGEIKIEKE